MSGELEMIKYTIQNGDNQGEFDLAWCVNRIEELEATIARVEPLVEQLATTGRRMTEQGVRERDDAERITHYANKLKKALDKS